MEWKFQLNGTLQFSSHGPRRKSNWLNSVRDRIATGNRTSLLGIYAKALLPRTGSVWSPLFRTFSLLAVYVDPAVSRDQLANHIKYPHSFSISSLLRQSAQLPSCVLLSASETQSPCCQWTAGRQASLSVTSSWVYSSSCPSSWWCHPTISSSVVPFSSCPQSFPASRSFFTNESSLHIRWPKYCSFSFSISPSNEYSGLISFRMDWLDLLAVQGTLKSLLQHHSSKT